MSATSRKVRDGKIPGSEPRPEVNAEKKAGPLDCLKLRLVIAYDGTAYQGWQTQKIGTGVQQIIEPALRKLVPNAGPLHSSSRTDTGVHAVGMVAHVEIPKHEFRMEPRKLLLALNAFLPDDIRILEVTRAASTFHARYDAKKKQYRYTVWNHAAQNPLLRTLAWHVPQPLDVHAMNTAAALFVGKHDFQSFAANPGYAKESTVRTVLKCEVKRLGPQIKFVVEGDGFLYKMCRGIVGTLVQVGRGKFAADEIKKMLVARDRRVAGMTAPAHGLVLWKVFY
jgi:tRNA pseudouridine38-40 synthase